MYEEEDDDLPVQYRRLTAHLQTGSADFNRRLSAYLTNHVAMRSALDQAITNSYAQQYPNAPQFAHNQHSMYPSPFIPPNMHQQQSPPQSYMQSQSTSANVAHFRPQQMRPVATTGQSSPNGFVHSSSTSSPAEQNDHGRASFQSKSTSPVAGRTPQSAQSRPSLPHVSSAYNYKQDSPTSVPTPSSPQSQQAPPTPASLYGSQGTSFLSTSLPPESQMLIGSALDPKDPFTTVLMGGNEDYSQYWGSSSLTKPRNFHPSYDGMSATLAPSALDMSLHQFSYSQNQQLSRSNLNSFTSFDSNLSDYPKGLFQSNNSSQGSGTVTPGLDSGGWDAFINDNSWAENAT